MPARHPARSALLVVALASLAACEAETDHLTLPGDGSSWTTTRTDDEPCEPGDVEDCGVSLGVQNGVASCIEGERVCRGGVWGPCEGSLIARPVGAEEELSTDDALTEDRRFDGATPRLASTGSEDCADVCDPDCEIFPDPIPGSVDLPSTPFEPPVYGGSRLSFEELVPSPFRASLLKSPCIGITGACQTDTYCNSSTNTCTPYEMDQRRATGGVDLTVGLPCGIGAESYIPVCNRGDVTAAAGVRLAFLSSNSNQLQYDLSRCTLDSNRSFSHECTIDQAIEPGECVRAPAACNVGLQGNNKALLVNPQRAAPNAIIARTEAPGACGNNWSWWDDAVSCDVCTPAVEAKTVARSGGACAPLSFGSIPTDLLTERTVIGTLRPKSTVAWTTLTRVQEAEGCSGGLEYWIDETQPTLTAHLCPATCDSVATATSPQLRVAVQCPVTFEPSLTASVTYEGVCPRGTRTEWRHLAYNALVPGDSTLDIEVRSGESEPLTADFIPVRRVDVSDDVSLDPLVVPVLDSAACLATDPDDDCPVSLWTELDGVPAANNPFLELRWTLTRSTNTRLSPELHSIEATFTCPDSE